MPTRKNRHFAAWRRSEPASTLRAAFIAGWEAALRDGWRYPDTDFHHVTAKMHELTSDLVHAMDAGPGGDKKIARMQADIREMHGLMVKLYKERKAFEEREKENG